MVNDDGSGKEGQIRALTPQLAEIAKQELGEDGNRLENDLAHIKNWLAKQDHLSARPDDQWIVTFLRGCKYSLEKTKQKLEFYYTMRMTVPEFFSNRDTGNESIRQILDLGCILALPTETATGRTRPIVLRYGHVEPNQIDLNSLVKTCFMVFDLLVREDDANNIAGHCLICDMRGSTARHVFSFTPVLVKKLVTCFEKGFPNRTKSISFVYNSGIFDLAFNALKPFLSEKLKSRVHNLGNSASGLEQFLHKSDIPKDMEGNGPSYQELIDYWKEKVASNHQWFKDDEKYKATRNPQPENRFSSEISFGIKGSFRKLDID